MLYINGSAPPGGEATSVVRRVAMTKGPARLREAGVRHHLRCSLQGLIPKAGRLVVGCCGSPRCSVHPRACRPVGRGCDGARDAQMVGAAPGWPGIRTRPDAGVFCFGSTPFGLGMVG